MYMSSSVFQLCLPNKPGAGLGDCSKLGNTSAVLIKKAPAANFGNVLKLESIGNALLAGKKLLQEALETSSK